MTRNLWKPDNPNATVYIVNIPNTHATCKNS